MNKVRIKFDVKVSHIWAKEFIANHHDDIRARKTKLIANKCIEPDMVSKVADFCAQVETFSKMYPMEDFNVVNYNETRVFLTSNGLIQLEHAAKA